MISTCALARSSLPALRRRLTRAAGALPESSSRLARHLPLRPYPPRVERE